jgi:hypothetical protein
MNKKVVVGVLVGLALLCVCAVVALVLAGAGVLGFAQVSVPYEAQVTVNAPTRVERDESFVIEVEIESLSSEAQILESIDIDLSYLEGIQIVRSSPPYRDTHLLAPLLEIRSHSFDYSIPAEGIVLVQLSASGVVEGDHSGEIYVCLNSAGNCQGSLVMCQGSLVRTVVGD